MSWNRRGAAGLALGFGLIASYGLAEPRSGFDFMTPQTQALQRDDFANPGMLWVGQGEALWKSFSCSSCHRDAETSMRGAATRHPAFDEASGRPIDLPGRINACLATKLNAPPLEREGADMLALSAYVAHQSRGLPVAPPDDPRLDPFRKNGEALFSRRQGQLNLSCANCHDDNPGQRLGGAVIPQAHPTGYPLYRLEWQSLGSLRRRMRNCTAGVRAESYDAASQDYIDLELYLMERARGLPIETPSVRP